MIILTPKARASVAFATEILEGGKVVARKQSRNLILNSGLDLVASYSWHDLIRYCAIGNGVTPTKRETPAGVTVAGEPDEEGEYAVASESFFSAADVGRIIKVAGESARIVAYVSATRVKTSELLSGPATATIYYVEQTALDNQIRRNSYNGDLDNGITWDGPTATLRHRHSFLFPVETAAVAYTEIGWSPTNGESLFGRAIIPGGGDSLTPNQQYRVIVDLHVTFDTSTHDYPVSLIDGWPTATGQGKIEDVNNLIPARDEMKAATWDGAGADAPLRDTTYRGNGDRGSLVWANFAKSAYVAGSYALEFTGVFAGASNGMQVNNIRAVGIWDGGRGHTIYRVLLDNPQSKLSTHALELKFRVTWDRVLS